VSSSTLPVSLVCCGLLDTTADDHGIQERAFAEACATQGIVPGTAAYAHHMVGVHQARGQSAVDVFRGLFPGEDGRAEAAALSFERSFRAAVDRTEISPMPGAEEAIGQLSESGVRVCLITSLSRRLLGLVLDSLRWWRLIDLTLCPEDAPRGCPWPDLMLAAMLRLGVEDVREAAFAGSTSSEIQCGQRSGAGIVAGVLAGGHTRDRLRDAGATHLVDGITELPGLLFGEGRSGGAGSGEAGSGEAGSAGGDAVAAGGARAGSASGAPAMPTASQAPSAASRSAPGPQVPLERRNSGL
jgi:phosphonatase-like hydrolase